jgi:hypothetical protein
MAAGDEILVWTIVLAETTDTRKERLVDFREKGVGLKGRIPTSKDGDVDMLSMWLHLYPGKIEDDLCRLHEEGFRKKAGWKLVTPHEWVAFIGIIYASRQFNQLGTGLWTYEATRVREALGFERFM